MTVMLLLTVMAALFLALWVIDTRRIRRELRAEASWPGGIEYDQRNASSSTAPHGSTCTMEQA